MKLLHILCILFLISSSTNAQYSQHESIGYASTAFSLQKGENRFTNTNIIISNYTRGLTDNLSFSVGGVLPSEFILPNVMARVKYTHKITDYLRVGISPIFGYEFYGEYSEFYTALTGIVTLGNPKHFISISYAKSFNSESNKYANNISLGFSVRFSEHFRLISENHLISDNSPFSSYEAFPGVATSLMLRWSFKKRHQVQFGYYIFTEYTAAYYDGIRPEPSIRLSIPTPIPSLSYSIYWGKG